MRQEFSVGKICPNWVRREAILRDYYNLDIVISVGYRVKSPNGVVFRKWANGVLKEYLLRGYTIDGQRTLVSDENYIALINKVESLDGRISKIEKCNYCLGE